MTPKLADHLPKLAAPAQRALAGAGITTLRDLASWRESDLKKLHGMGPNALQTLKTAMEAWGIAFVAE
ncbi:DNA-directed RNA polymerase subunit alpha C-terminal domain-containing protein [Chitinophaga lutea]